MWWVGLLEHLLDLELVEPVKCLRGSSTGLSVHALGEVTGLTIMIIGGVSVR